LFALERQLYRPRLGEPANLHTVVLQCLFYPLVSGRDDGTGLGLHLAQDLVSRHNGLIEFQSEPGRTVFMVRLPIDADPDSPAAATGGEES